MLGWWIGIYRQEESSLLPPKYETALGASLADWQTGIHGLDWLDDLVKAGNAIDLGGNGYPCRYTATARYLLPHIISPPNREQDERVISDDENDDHWDEPTVTHPDVASLCHPDEWLLVEAWDQS
jgi:hypothetical protein